MVREKALRGGSFPMFLMFLVVSFGMTQAEAQPQHFFKANAPVSKSLPRIGRRSDLDTFPMFMHLSSDPQGENSWPGGNVIKGGLTSDPGEEGYIIPFLEEDHRPPNSIQIGNLLWRKLMGADVDPSEIRSIMDPASTKNLYRSRTQK